MEKIFELLNDTLEYQYELISDYTESLEKYKINVIDIETKIIGIKDYIQDLKKGIEKLENE